MTYCVGYWLEEGLVLASDSRTNAGVDYISTYSKMHVFQPGPDRLHRVRRVRRTRGATQVGAGRDRRSLLLQPGERRDGGPDPQVVGDDAVTDRDVEVHPDQDVRSVERRQVLELGNAEPHWLAAPTMSDRSTSRLE